MSSLRRASTICLVRDVDPPEVLMVRRPETSRFMPGAWVFPGGVVDAADADPPPGFGDAEDWEVAALREMIEETGIWLTTDGVIERPLTDRAFQERRQAPEDRLAGQRLEVGEGLEVQALER